MYYSRHNLKSSVFVLVLPVCLAGCTGEVASLKLPVTVGQTVGQTVVSHLWTSPPQDLNLPDLSPAEMFLFPPPDFGEDEDGGGQEDDGRHHEEHQAADSDVSLLNISD